MINLNSEKQLLEKLLASTNETAQITEDDALYVARHWQKVVNLLVRYYKIENYKKSKAKDAITSILKAHGFTDEDFEYMEINRCAVKTHNATNHRQHCGMEVPESFSTLFEKSWRKIGFAEGKVTPVIYSRPDEIKIKKSVLNYFINLQNAPYNLTEDQVRVLFTAYVIFLLNTANSDKETNKIWFYEYETGLFRSMVGVYRKYKDHSPDTNWTEPSHKKNFLTEIWLPLHRLELLKRNCSLEERINLEDWQHKKHKPDTQTLELLFLNTEDFQRASQENSDEVTLKIDDFSQPGKFIMNYSIKNRVVTKNFVKIKRDNRAKKTTKLKVMVCPDCGEKFEIPMTNNRTTRCNNCRKIKAARANADRQAKFRKMKDEER